jgi:hypothetical protein
MKKHFLACLVGLALVLGMAPRAHAAVVSLYQGDRLFINQSLVAPHCGFRLVFQTDGNLVEYDAYNRIIWSSGTANRGGAYTAMLPDGSLVIYTWAGDVLWHSGTFGNWGARLDVQDDGKLVIRRSDNTLVWASSFDLNPNQGSSICPASALTSTEPDTNRFGGDYVGLDLSQPKPIWCAAYCAQDARCRAYSYVPPGVQGPQAKCWLKDSVPATGYAPGVVSGVIYR